MKAGISVIGPKQISWNVRFMFASEFTAIIELAIAHIR